MRGMTGAALTVESLIAMTGMQGISDSDARKVRHLDVADDEHQSPDYHQHRQHNLPCPVVEPGFKRLARSLSEIGCLLTQRVPSTAQPALSVRLSRGDQISESSSLVKPTGRTVLLDDLEE